MNNDYAVLVDENGTPYIAHGRFHKYIKKIGDRYFYTMKELQAYYNNQKAKVLGRASAKAMNASLNAAARTRYYNFEHDVINGRKIAKVQAVFNSALTDSLSFVSKVLGRSAARAAERVIKANAAIKKREVERWCEEKFGDTNDTREKILEWIFG